MSNRIGGLSVPKGVERYVEQGLECFQNDEGSVEANAAGMIEENLCDTIWSVTKNCLIRYQTRKPAPIIKGDRASERLMSYMTFQWHNCLYKNQDNDNEEMEIEGSLLEVYPF